MNHIRNISLLVFALIACAQPHAAAQTIDDLLGDGRSRWAQFQLVDGRIRTVSPYFGRFRVYPPNDKKQRLTIGTNMAGVGVLGFRWSGEKYDVAAEATETGQLTITHSPREDSDTPHRSFTQPKQGLVVLEVGPGGKERYEAESIWHLLLEHPKVCREHLYPLINVLRGGWQWDEQLQKLKAELFRLAKVSNLPDRTKWAALVKQLASKKFVERQKAQRQLRGYGRAVVPYLQSLDRNTLDAEQEFRIKQIVKTLYGGSNDTPGRAATWLVSDPNTWLLLMASDDVVHRRQAAKQLNDLVGRSLEFKPDADMETRKKQIEQIRKSLTR